MYIERELEGEINKYLTKKEIIAIIGPRQCGKTTLMKHIFKKLKKAIFIDFEDREKLELFAEDIDSFIELYVKGYDYLFIDEFQYAKNGGKNLKYIYDNNKTKIIISGSSATELSIQSIKYLVGRIFVFNLFPLSFLEYLNYKNKKLYSLCLKKRISEPIEKKLNKIYEEFLIYGGYPRVVLSETNEEKETVLKNIYNTYFLKEIKEILNLTTDYKLSKLIHALSLQIGGIINYHKLSGITDFDYKALLNHLNILEKTFICKLIKPFYSNKRLELTKAPKIYFIDSGLANSISKNFKRVKERADKGKLNENFIASELIKKEIELKYWRTKSKAEVDFVLEKPEITAVEVKSYKTGMRIGKSLISFIDKYSPKKAFVISSKDKGERKYKKTKVIFLQPYKLISQI